MFFQSSLLTLMLSKGPSSKLDSIDSVLCYDVFAKLFVFEFRDRNP